MNAKERKAHKRFEQKDWKKRFSEWLLGANESFCLEEATLTYSQVKVPMVMNGNKISCFFDIIYSDSTKAKSNNFYAVSLSELLNAINVGVERHKFVHITKTQNDYEIESYTYEEMIPFLSVSPFVFKFNFNKQPDRKTKTVINKSKLSYNSYPEPAVNLNEPRLVELINLFGDYKTNKK